jgi:hypothetical protein
MTKPRSTLRTYFASRDVSRSVCIPLFILSFFSIFSGYLFSEFFLGSGISVFNGVFPNRGVFQNVEVVVISEIVLLIPTFFSIVGFFFGSYLDYFIVFTKIKKILYFKSANSALFFDSFYNKNLSISILKFAVFFSFRLLDRTFLEFFGPTGICFSLKRIVFFGSKFYTGRLENFIFLLIYAVLMCIFVF